MWISRRAGRKADGARALESLNGAPGRFFNLVPWADPNGLVRTAYAHRRPDDPAAWSLWGNVVYLQRKYEEAEAILKEGLKRHPAHPGIGSLLAEVLTHESRLEEAGQLLEALREANPHSRAPFLGLVYWAATRGAWEEALSYADEAERRTPPQDHYALYELGLQIHVIRAAKHRAIGLLGNAARGLPRYAPCHALLGILLEDEDEAASRKHMARARRTWKSPEDFDEWLREARNAYRTVVLGEEDQSRS